MEETFSHWPFSRKPASTKSFTRGVKNIRLFCRASALVQIRVRLHRTLGLAGAVLGTSMIFVGFWGGDGHGAV